jgi:hypothetical protein
MAKKKAHEKQQEKKVRIHEGCGGEVMVAQNGETGRMGRFCYKCCSFIKKE